MQQFPFSNDLVTTAFAPIIVLAPISTFLKILAPGPIYTLSPIFGTESASIPVLIFTP